MGKIALLVVDVQTGVIELHPYKENEMLSNIKELSSACRANQIEVIYVRHDAGVGSVFERNSKAWQIHEDIAPLPGEKIVDKCFNSAFRDTDLKEYLDENDISTIILVGMQTEYCIDVTCKVAFEYGYEVIIPEDTTTTFGNSFLTGEAMNEYYQHKIWNNRYAIVKSIQDVLRSNIHNAN